MNKAEVTRDILMGALDYEPSTGLFRWRPGRQRAGALTGTLGKRGYVVVDFHGLKFYAHRLAWLFANKRWPDHTIDHINGVKTDNRLANLRDVPIQVNSQNVSRAYRNSKSQLLGVSWRNGRWHAKIHVDGEDRLVGKFDDPDAAHAAYMAAKRAAHPGCTA